MTPGSGQTAILPTAVAFPALPPSLPQRPYPTLVRWAGRLILAALGVRLAGGFADTPRAVLIGWPHTSNLDGIVALAGVAVVGLRPGIAAKHSLFRRGLGPVLRAFGAFPVRRGAAGGTVGQLTEAFAEAARAGRPLWIAVSPEGTRSRGDGWKTGWHRTAVTAGVPVAVLAFDWGLRRSERRLVALGAVQPTGDLATDTAAVEALLAGVVGRHPDRATPA
ncbi:MAG TPA: 1-acyl-sn-glycerol-3-phosphate acyltransferase [Rubricoccaceae bacterium]